MKTQQEIEKWQTENDFSFSFVAKSTDGQLQPFSKIVPADATNIGFSINDLGRAFSLPQGLFIVYMDDKKEFEENFTKEKPLDNAGGVAHIREIGAFKKGKHQMRLVVTRSGETSRAVTLNYEIN
ncbi:hypothetical protein [Enterococcus timonensis]|uniref:hypothetical protein n=1 Tax=Enterococcus timonensis TaxID=1852364 RepID=UPI00131A2DB1|nr:hypothetical protein [Enterococcus timonensis]